MLCDKRLCTGCRACENICSFNSIAMKEDNEGFLRPVIDDTLCTHCGRCEKACPLLSDPYFEKLDEPGVYACWSLDDEVRQRSSSGGVFSLLSKAVLDEGGVVFGAAFDEELRVHHTPIEDYGRIDDLRRSKYVQSDTGQSYQEAEAFLKAGRIVLFVGAPCQIAGLQGYLKKTYDRLITCSFVCYGVPSPKVWRSYLSYRQQEHGKKIKSVSFRDKQESDWFNCKMRIGFEDGSSDSRPLKEDAYYIGFGRSLFARPSCFDCRFRYSNTKADITLADFWGIEKLEGIEGALDKGVSLVLASSGKGEALMEEISPRMYIHKKTLEEAASCNPKLGSSARLPPNRARFFRDFQKNIPFDRLVYRYMRNTGLKAEVKKRIKALLGENLVKKIKGQA